MASSWNHHDLAAVPFCSLQKQFTSKHPLGNNHFHYRPLCYLGPMILCYDPPRTNLRDYASWYVLRPSGRETH